jgi:hypothetical protein
MDAVSGSSYLTSRRESPAYRRPCLKDAVTRGPCRRASGTPCPGALVGQSWRGFNILKNLVPLFECVTTAEELLHQRERRPLPFRIQRLGREEFDVAMAILRSVLCPVWYHFEAEESTWPQPSAAPPPSTILGTMARLGLRLLALAI